MTVLTLVIVRDVQLTNVSITHHGVNILEDTSIELNFGRRYGLIGHNGCGKSTMLTLLGLWSLI